MMNKNGGHGKRGRRSTSTWTFRFIPSKMARGDLLFATNAVFHVGFCTSNFSDPVGGTLLKKSLQSRYVAAYVATRQGNHCSSLLLLAVCVISTHTAIVGVWERTRTCPYFHLLPYTVLVCIPSLYGSFHKDLNMVS